MLILLFRGIFLIGILSWYSTNVWKMIDGYFKDSFEKYLQREYQKNPKMREDVNAYGLSEENDKGRSSHVSIETRTTKSIPNTNAEQRSCERLAALGEETCPIDSASMEAVAGAQAGSGSLSPALSAGDMTNGGHASKSEVSAKGGVHKNAYLEGSSRSSAGKTSEELPVKNTIIDDNDDTARSMLIMPKSINMENSHDNPIKMPSKGFPMEHIITDDDKIAKSMLVVRKSINDDDSYENVIESKTTTAAKTFEELPVKGINADDDNMPKSMLVVRKSINNDNSHENTIETETSRATTTERNIRHVETPDAGGIAAKKATNRKSTLRRSSREQQKTEILEDKEKMKKKKKQKVKTITLTDEDFKQAKLRAGLQDYDFSEFDDDDNEGAEPIPEGILVSQLPFKPRADIGNLERVTHEEFCPLTLEDEANCGETKSWP